MRGNLIPVCVALHALLPPNISKDVCVPSISLIPRLHTKIEIRDDAESGRRIDKGDSQCHQGER